MVYMTLQGCQGKSMDSKTWSEEDINPTERNQVTAAPGNKKAKESSQLNVLLYSAGSQVFKLPQGWFTIMPRPKHQGPIALGCQSCPGGGGCNLGILTHLGLIIFRYLERDP
ncbi:hypothetical protein AVEN_207114-1 [Araneus ventricosus]|uniref:Uncharacterized protein n=1 Tax=Araneus ventricosus TaxID=182803 RepID=A0A4Y2JGN7_ARAVE|nr:hypothetical protein AVEN_207114-1 [Araneus ventricosus]